MARVIAMLVGVVLAASAAVPASAQESQIVAPSGNPGVQEHLELVPAAGGDRPADRGGGRAAPTNGEAVGTPPTGREVLGARTAQALSRLGPDGRDAAAVAAAGAPSDARRGKPDRNKSATRSRSVRVEADGSSAEAVAGALAGTGGGVGLAFPLFLAGTLAMALALLASRRAARRE